MQISDSCRQDMFIARSSREKEVTGLHVKDLFSNAFICFFFLILCWLLQLRLYITLELLLVLDMLSVCNSYWI